MFYVTTARIVTHISSVKYSTITLYKQLRQPCKIHYEIPVIEALILQKSTYENIGYDYPVKFVTTLLIFCYESPDLCCYETSVID